MVVRLCCDVRLKTVRQAPKIGGQKPNRAVGKSYAKQRLKPGCISMTVFRPSIHGVLWHPPDDSALISQAVAAPGSAHPSSAA